MAEDVVEDKVEDIAEDMVVNVENAVEDTTKHALAILLLYLDKHSRKDLGESGF